MCSFTKKTHNRGSAPDPAGGRPSPRPPVFLYVPPIILWDRRRCSWKRQCHSISHMMTMMMIVWNEVTVMNNHDTIFMFRGNVSYCVKLELGGQTDRNFNFPRSYVRWPVTVMPQMFFSLDVRTSTTFTCARLHTWSLSTDRQIDWQHDDGTRPVRIDCSLYICDAAYNDW